MRPEAVLAQAVQRRLIRTAILKDADAFEALYERLRDAMSKAWDDAMREGIAGALDRLRDLGAGSFTPEDGRMIMRVLEAFVGEEAIRAVMREPVVNLSDALFRLGAEEVGQATGVTIAFMRPDLDALDIIKSGNLYWIGNSWNTHTQELFAKALNDYFEEGMTREQLTERFATDFASLSDRGRRYWELLADHTATKTREMGRVSGYERAAVELVEVRAHIDERTTDICKKMHGQIIEVRDLSQQRADYLDAASRRDEFAAKEAWPMFAGDAPKNLPRTGPPYHFRCRTITVVHFRREGWQIAQMPVVPSRSRVEVEEWVRENLAEKAEFNRSISAKNSSRFAASIAQVRAHFDLGKLNVLASGDLLVRDEPGLLAFFMPTVSAIGVNPAAFLRLNNDKFPRPETPDSRLDFSGVEFRWFAARPSVAYLARHEYAHWFHHHYKRDVENALEAAFADDPGWPLMISRYGLTDGYEWFAEMFALYFEGEEQHFRIPPPVLKLLKGKDLLNANDS